MKIMTLFCCNQERNVFTLIKITLKRIKLQMPDTTQMEAILKGFPNVMDFDQFKVNSKNINRIKVSFKSHLKILHQLTTSCFQFMIKCSQIDQNVCDWCQLLHFFQLFGFLMEKSFLSDFLAKKSQIKNLYLFYASHCKHEKSQFRPGTCSQSP